MSLSLGIKPLYHFQKTSLVADPKLWYTPVDFPMALENSENSTSDARIQAVYNITVPQLAANASGEKTTNEAGEVYRSRSLQAKKSGPCLAKSLKRRRGLKWGPLEIDIIEKGWCERKTDSEIAQDIFECCKTVRTPVAVCKERKRLGIANSHWSQQEVDILMKGVREGKDDSQIAQEIYKLCNITRTAMAVKLKRTRSIGKIGQIFQIYQNSHRYR